MSCGVEELLMRSVDGPTSFVGAPEVRDDVL